MTPSTPDTRQLDAQPALGPVSIASASTSLADKSSATIPAKSTVDALRKPWELRDDELTEAQTVNAESAAEATGLDGTVLAEASELGQLEDASTGQHAVATPDQAGSTAVAGGAGISPAMIGGGLLGAVVIAAAAGGSSGGGSKPDTPPQANNNRPGSEDRLATQPPGNRDTEPTVEMRPTGPAKAEGPHDAPQVAPEGLTRLNIASFEQAAVEGKPLEYIRITQIFAADGSEAEGRVVRFGNEGARTDAQSIGRGTLVLKAPDANTPADDTLTAYEVIKVAGGITRADAEKMAAEKGGKLLQINDATEMAWISQNLFGILGEHDGDDAPESAAQLVKNGAWFGGKSYDSADAAHDAIIRASGTHADGAKTYDTSADKLGSFVIEYGNYVSPLGLLGEDGKVKPILPGTTLAMEDAKRLVWNGDKNAIGLLKFQAVQGPEDDAPVVEGAREVSLKLTESPDVQPPMAPVTPDAAAPGNPAEPPQSGTPGSTTPDGRAPSGQPHQPGTDTPPPQGSGDGQTNQPGNNSHQGNPPQSGNPSTPAPGQDKQIVSVKLDSFLPLDAGLFRGTGTNAPAFIRITDVSQKAGTSADKSPLVLNKGGDGANADKELGTASGQESIVAAADFGKISWNATQNQGGSFSFQMLNADKQPIAGSATQTVTVFEQPAAPQYDTSRQLIGVARDATANFTAEHFAGQTNPASRIRILAVDETEDTVRFLSALQKTEGNNDPTPVNKGDVIESGDFGKLSWFTNTNEGGVLRFVAIDEHGNPLGSAQQITVYELPEAPVYSENANRISIGHDQNAGLLKASLFEGTDPNKAPAYIRITAVNETNDSKDAESALSVLRNGVAERLLGNSNEVAHDDFGNLRWDASSNEGGTFTFQALDQHKQPISGVEAQTITVFEQPAKPSYQDSYELTLGHNATGLHQVTEAHFTGSDSNKPAKVKITELHAFNNHNAGDTAQVLFIGNGQNSGQSDGSQNDQKTAIKLNDVIDSANFGKIYWDSTSNQSGRITFQALDEHGEPIFGTNPVTIHVKEQAESTATGGAQSGSTGDQSQQPSQTNEQAQTGTGGSGEQAQSGSGTGSLEQGEPRSDQPQSEPQSQAQTGQTSNQASTTDSEKQEDEGDSDSTEQKADGEAASLPTAQAAGSPQAAQTEVQSGQELQSSQETRDGAESGSSTQHQQDGDAKASGEEGEDDKDVSERDSASEASPKAPGAGVGDSDSAGETLSVTPKAFFIDSGFSTMESLAPMHDYSSLNTGF